MEQLDYEDENSSLWIEYKKTNSQELKEELILKYAPLVKFVAGRIGIYFGGNVEYEDLVSYGIFGLIDAIDKFDLDKGVKFRTYASLRIRGAIIDSVRNLDWIPRSLRQKSKELEKLYSDLENELGRSATDEDVASKLGISVEEFGKMLTDINISSLISLDEYFEQNYDHGISPKDTSKETQPEGFVEKNEIKTILGKSIDMLPEKEKMVVTLYYYEELTLKEISVIMNVSESRISQLHTKAIMRLKGKLGRQKSVLMDNQ
ncbi:MAG: FliA/WhiG family RNA polymerase sigma factor [Clostridiales bacterium]|nr:FliA/WhiG family RNA polymerase sigma factor [Clostridiales bacterium]